MAQRAPSVHGMTFEEAALLDPDKFPGEIQRGEWKPMTKGTWNHGEIVVRVSVLLALFARANSGWSVSSADPGTKLARNPDTLRGPDVGVIRAERKPTGKGAAGWLDGAPDLAVEVIGDSQTIAELMRKALEYLAAGGKVVWVVDPDARSVLVVTPPDHVRIVGPEGALDGGDALPGFACRVAELFE